MIGGGGLVEVTGPGAGEPVLVSQQWLADTIHAASTVQVAPCHPRHRRPARRRHRDSGCGRGPCREGGRRRGRVRRRLLPALHADGETDPGPRPALPVPRLHHRRRVLRPRPRPTLAARPHPRRQPDLPVPTPPPGQATPRLEGGTHCRRGRHLDRPHRPGPHHPPRRRPPNHHPHRHRTGTCTTGPGTSAATAAPATSSTSRARTVIPDGPHSELEFLLEHHGAAPPAHPPTRTPVTVWRDDHGRRHRTDLLPPIGTLVIDHHAWPGRRERHPRQCRDTDLPPF